MKKHTITGGEGFIGSKIKARVKGESFDLKSNLDILNKKQLIEACKESKGIFHCAAKISVPESILIPKQYHKTNVTGTKNVIEIADNFKLKTVFCSSAAVYGEKNRPINENEKLNPKSPYAENKRDAEELLKKTIIPSVALRYFNVYGPGQSDMYAGVITFFIKQALQGKDLVIFGDGKQVRDFIFIDDVVEANVLAMKTSFKTFEIFNIGSGKETSIKELAEKIISITKSSSKITYKPARIGDIVYSQANISKAKKNLKWSPKTTLEDGLKKTIAYYKKST